MPSALARLLLSFLPDRAIPSMLSVSHSARQLCACLYELDLSSCEKLTDVSFLSSLVRLRTLDLSECSYQLVDVSPSSLTPLNAVYLLNAFFRRSQLADVSPLSGFVALETLRLVGCVRLIDVSPLSSLTSLTSLNLSWCYLLSDVSALSSLTSLTTLDLRYCHLVNVSALPSLSQLTILR